MINKTKNSILKRWARGIFRVKKALIGLYLIGGFIFISVIGPLFAKDPIAFLGTPSVSYTHLTLPTRAVV